MFQKTATLVAQSQRAGPSNKDSKYQSDLIKGHIRLLEQLLEPAEHRGPRTWFLFWGKGKVTGESGTVLDRPVLD